MTTRAKTIVLAFTMVSVLATPFAEAARIGKGKSAGMQRSAPTRSYQPAAPAQQPMAAPQARGGAAAPAQAPAKSGVGTALAAGAAGAVAGAAIGYMAGSSGNDKAAQQPGQQQNAMPADQQPQAAHQAAPQQQPEKGGMPWGMLALLGLALVGGMMFFRRKAGNPAANAPQPAGMPRGMADQTPQSSFDAIPKIGSGLNGGAAPAGNGLGGGFNAAPAAARLPDGTETPHFLRQAKATFLHLQNLNSADSLEEVRKYMTPDLFNALREDIAGNSGVADFPQLDCQLSDASIENGAYIASVTFSGNVSEEVGAPAVPFTETWHYVKDGTTGGKWLVAGIQQG
ncbi:Tim44 domain-containing protein [Chromobacterium phragmitis]|uniref:Tim44 domain-containing protein n=1 Tax=Chromobacterium phragmitis TaxID=2202141 RepID=A0A344UHX6_9NEIS|nr:Tim44-like domain-containing protein [Chromobacterium phragmitis]AXE29499.1 Tim44 domain-containing protein [Chromobacterium phragmitis]AXE34874.1 Tim44 domain-containing protein [Chromobacterium phragmitis]